jgi:hypothetical protein
MHPQRTLRGLIWILAVIALWCVAPLAAAAADPGPKPDPRYVITRLGDQGPALPVLPPGASATQVQSFKFSSQGRITIAGESGELRFTMTGEVAMPDHIHLTLTLTDPDTGELLPLEFVLIGKTPYIHLPSGITPDGKDVWVLVDDTDALMAISGMGMPNLASLPPIPTQTQTIGDETVNGTPTTHTRTTIDATALLGGSAKGSKPSTLTLDQWLGKSDNFPRRLTINGTVSIDPNALFGDLSNDSGLSSEIVNATLSYSMDFTDINAPVTVSAPTTYVKLSDLIGTP